MYNFQNNLNNIYYKIFLINIKIMNSSSSEKESGSKSNDNSKIKKDNQEQNDKKMY